MNFSFFPSVLMLFQSANASGNLTRGSVVSSLAGYIDLTTLSDLSQTCRQVRANLLQYRVMLIQKTLRCQNEFTDLGTRLGGAFMASRDAWSTYGRHGIKVDRITSGRVGACARDMVSECRSCGDAICRVCSSSCFCASSIADDCNRTV